MTSRAKLELKGFLISKETGGVKTSLSISSTAFLYNISFANATPDQVLWYLKTKKMWLLPPGSSRFDLRVDLRQLNASPTEGSHFIEFLAHELGQLSLWSRLGLVVRLLDNGIQYHQEDDSPNIFLGIEQPDMSSALLSPPHAQTAQLKGLESMLRLESSIEPESSGVQREQIGPGQPVWDDAIRLVEAALDFTFGTRHHYPTLKTHRLNNNAPSLLDIAPAIWNSHYQKSVASHAKKFPVISSVLASTERAQSPQLRRRLTTLLREAPPPARGGMSHGAEHASAGSRPSIERQLWELLGSTLKTTTGSTKKARNDLPSEATVESSYSDAQGGRLENGSLDRPIQHDMLSQYQYYSQNSHPQNTIFNDFQRSASGYFDLPGSQESTGTMVEDEPVERDNAHQNTEIFRQNLHSHPDQVHQSDQDVRGTYPIYGHISEEVNSPAIFEAGQVSVTPTALYRAEHPYGYHMYPVEDYREPKQPG